VAICIELNLFVFKFGENCIPKNLRILKSALNFYLASMEQHALKSLNHCLNTNIYSYLKTNVGQSSNLYLNVDHFFNTSAY
jgi:hypothetical protein